MPWPFQVSAAAFLISNCFPVEEELVCGVTIWIIADIEQAPGRQMLLNALKHMVSCCRFYFQLVEATGNI